MEVDFRGFLIVNVPSRYFKDVARIRVNVLNVLDAGYLLIKVCPSRNVDDCIRFSVATLLPKGIPLILFWSGCP